jgi:Tfp pilus assembly protein PilF
MLFSIRFRSLALCLVLSACQNSQQEKIVSSEPERPMLAYDSNHFELTETPSVEDIFALNEKDKDAFLKYYFAANNATVAGHKRLFNYLEDKLSNFDFRGKTYTASQTVQHASGNCLSLAIFTASLADLVGLETSYQRVNSAPIYHRYHNVMTLSSHVQTHLYDPNFAKQDGFIYIGKPKIIIDYFPSQGNVRGDEVSEADFISMLYQNLAGDELVKENYNSAYSLILQAINISPLNADLLNTLAVLFKKAGRGDQAEVIYDFAIQHTTGSVDVISNYILLLEQQSRIQEAKLLEERIVGIEDDNPYRWFDIANRLFSRADFQRALHFYKRAVDAGPYLHESYFGLAKTYYQLGETEKAELAMENALDLSFLPGDKNLYQAKLRILGNAQ